MEGCSCARTSLGAAKLNDELNIGVLDAAAAQELRAAFFRDLRHTREQKLGEWRERSWWHKVKDGVAYLGRSQY